MPQLKQPMTLKDKSLQECVILYRGSCERWISKMRQAQETGRIAYFNMTWSVLAECRQIKRSLSELPYLTIEMMSPQLTSEFAEIIGYYILQYRNFPLGFRNEERHNSLCTAMFGSVLTSYVYKYDDEIIWWNSTRNLILQTLASVPGLRTLHLTHPREEDDPAQILRMICHVSHLQAFTYKYNCTDEVVEQLALYCTRLKEISLCESESVTNASVQYLLQLRKLEFLNLDGTLIDNEQYGLLLSELPQIKDIDFNFGSERILDHVAEKDLRKISHVRGPVCNISMLTQRCCYITNLDIHARVYLTPVDLSGLTPLTTLRTVRISTGYYDACNLNAALTGIGPRLTDLTLRSVKRVNLRDIVTLCPLLASLSLLECTLLPLDPNTPFDPQLPHFRNVISLHIINYGIEDTNYNYIRHYVSLKKIRLTEIYIFAVEFMREVVRSGTLAQLEEFCVDEYRPEGLTMEALQMLIEHCSYLKRIKFLGPLYSFDRRFVQELKRRLLVRNLDLEVIRGIVIVQHSLK
jgi:hypothetical protein